MLHTHVHPGAVLKDLLEDMDISISKAADDLDISRQVLSGIVNGRRPITSDMAVRVGHYIGNGPGVWARMQAAYDLAESEKRLESELRHIPKAAAAG